MDARKRFVVPLIMTILLLSSVHAMAATYTLPVNTATLVVSVDNYDKVGQPGVPYDLYINPSTLQFGYDPTSHLVYESAIIFDWSEFLNVPTSSITLGELHLAPVSLPDRDHCYLQEVDVDHAIPSWADFNWQNGSGVTLLNALDPPDMVYVPVFGSLAISDTNRYSGWILTSAFCSDQVDEMAEPYLRVTTVPEPSSALCLSSTLVLLGLALRRRRYAYMAAATMICLSLLFAGAALAQDDLEINSEPGGVGILPQSAMPGFPESSLPGDYKMLPAFPRFLWSYGCVPTSGAMIVGYYDNAGFPNMVHHPDGTDYLCPTGNYPCDNGIFLKSSDSHDPYNPKYPSRCAISASEMGVLDRATFGHVDDYWTGTFGSTSDPYYDIVALWTPHADDCLADYMGTSIYHWRRNGDGGSVISVNATTGAAYRWRPTRYPYPNGSGPGYTIVEAVYGLNEYITNYAGYYCTTAYATDNDPFNSVADFYSRTVANYKTSVGVTAQDIADEIDAGRPVMVNLVQLSHAGNPPNDYWYEPSVTSRHAFPVFGYKWTIEGSEQRLMLLGYDTWYEDKLEDNRTYRTMKFPNATEAAYNSGGATYPSLTRQSDSTRWKIYAFSFLKINNNDRCPLPLGTNDYPSGAYADAFDISFDLPAGNSRVHYSGWTPTPASPQSSSMPMEMEHCTSTKTVYSTSEPIETPHRRTHTWRAMSSAAYTPSSRRTRTSRSSPTIPRSPWSTALSRT